MNLYTAEQIRDWDQFTIKNEPISSIDLMERAANSCTNWLLSNISPTTYKIFCGKGNNGGDGLAIARQLAKHDLEVMVYILEFGKPGTDDFQENLRRLHAHNVSINFIQNEQFFPAITAADTLIECLYGSGLNRPLDGLSAALVNHLNQSPATIISVDIPAGMFVSQSSRGNQIISARHTLTFQTTKLCFLLPENEACCGEVTVLDIGLLPGFVPDQKPALQLVDESLMKAIYQPRKQFSHKGTFGHALIVAGSKGKMGACILSSRACLRSGAGLVTSAVPEWGMPVIQTAFPEAMAIPFDDINDVNWQAYQAIGIGPGLGTGVDAAHLLKKCISSFKKPMVIDADGLNILSLNKDWLSLIPANSIITPHPKEFERLFGKASNDFERLEITLKNAADLNLYIVLKGHKTFIACPNGIGYFNTTGNAGMATAGSGDVLTGILTGLLAQSYEPEKACLLGVYLHGLAGDIAVENGSQEAMIASDLIHYLGRAYLQLLPV